MAALIAAVYLLVEPRTVDFAAHTFRAELFGREGFTIWNGQWYGGHHTVAYSVLFPPLAWLLGPALLGALSTVAAAALFEPLARAHFGEHARWGALWFGAGTVAILFTGRLPFGLGVAIGLGAALALQRGRPGLAAVLALLCSLASPVAGVFLALAAVSYALASRPRLRDALRHPLSLTRHPGSLVAVAALAPPLLLAVAFPEGGRQPFALSAFLPVPVFVAGCLLLLPKRERALRIGAVLYGVATLAAFALHTPVGSNAARLGALLGGPLAACVLIEPLRRRLHHTTTGIAAVLVALAAWQLAPAIRDTANAVSDPAHAASYYRPLLDFLDSQSGPPGRLEVVFTRSHWEAAEVAPQFPLARGWQRQLDTGANPLFYDGLRDLTYANWLAEHAVRWVALPSAKPDYSSYRERALVEQAPPYLRPVWSSPDWRVYELTLPHPLVIPRHGAPIRLAELHSDEFTLAAAAPGEALVRVRWSPYWRARSGCVERDGDWTRVIARHPGPLRVTISFSLERILSRGRRCG